MQAHDSRNHKTAPIVLGSLGVIVAFGATVGVLVDESNRAGWLAAGMAALQLVAYAGLWVITARYTGAAEDLAETTKAQSATQKDLGELLTRQTEAASDLRQLVRIQENSNKALVSAIEKFVDGELRLAESTAQIADSYDRLVSLTESAQEANLVLVHDFGVADFAEKPITVRNTGAGPAWVVRHHVIVLDLTMGELQQKVAEYWDAVETVVPGETRSMVMREIDRSRPLPSSFSDLWTDEDLAFARSLLSQQGTAKGRPAVLVMVQYLKRRRGVRERLRGIANGGGIGEPTYYVDMAHDA